MRKKPCFTTEQFIEKAKKIHGNKYDYSKVDYKRSQMKVCIVCPKHGEFWQTANSHLSGHGCHKCMVEENAARFKRTKEDFIKRAIELYGDKFDYSKVEYAGCKKNVKIICKKHGEFLRTPDDLLQGCGCPKCGYETTAEKLSMGTDEFIKRMEALNKGNLDFSKVKYKNAYQRVLVICHKKDEYGCEHGEFYGTPRRLLDGSAGCPKCNMSALETFTRKCLKEGGVRYEEQKRFPWLLNLGQLSLDFYLPDYNIAIECQGHQHFTDATIFKEDFYKITERDKVKNALCKEHGIKIIYVALKKYKKLAENLFYKDEKVLYVTNVKKISFEDGIKPYLG